MKYILCLIVFVGVSKTHGASMGTERGGGNVIGQELADLTLNQQAVRLPDVVIENYLSDFIAIFLETVPGLALNLISNDVVFYLEGRTISPEGCGFKNVFNVQGKMAACMTWIKGSPADVRIPFSFWKTATPELKTKIILHEILRKQEFDKSLTDEHLYKVTQAILQYEGADIFAYSENIRNVFYNYGFGYYRLKSEMDRDLMAIQNEIIPLCRQSNLAFKILLDSKIRSYFKSAYNEALKGDGLAYDRAGNFAYFADLFCQDQELFCSHFSEGKTNTTLGWYPKGIKVTTSSNTSCHIK